MNRRCPRPAHPTLLLAGLVLLALLVGCRGPDEASPRIESPGPQLLAPELQAWRDYIRPRASELAWREEIPWLPTYGEGVRRAAQERKPLLLWVMNGHPLGCT